MPETTTTTPDNEQWVPKCLILDDEENARLILQRFLENDLGCRAALVTGDPQEVLDALKRETFDLAFLDVELKGALSGLEITQFVPSETKIVLISGKQEYAARAFELPVMDYLIKPVTKHRLKITLRRLEDSRSLHQHLQESAKQKTPATEPQRSPHMVFIKHQGRYTRLDVREISHIEAVGDYVEVFTPKKKYTVHSTMKALEEKLSPHNFLRVHRSYLVNLDHVLEMEENTLSVYGHNLPVGKSYREKLMNRLNLL